MLFRRIAVLTALSIACASRADYQQTNLTSDGYVPANFIDPNLVNPWGLAWAPGSPIWIADNGTNVSTLYDTNGSIIPLVVGTQVNPTGIVFYGGNGFQDSSGNTSFFIFSSESGMISGWGGAANASILYDNSSSGAIYKGLGIIGENIYATNFASGLIEEYNSTTGFVGSFTDGSLTSLGYDPFGIQAIGSDLFVTYALNNGSGGDQAGAGNGYVDEFDASGNLVRRVYSNGVLNSPWGLAMAPSNFGTFSNDLLVGNFGDGTINAFDPVSGNYMGTLSIGGVPVVIDGLWGLNFGNGSGAGPTNYLYFTAGLNHEKDGLYGDIRNAPAPGAAVSLLAGLAMNLRRRRKS